MKCTTSICLIALACTAAFSATQVIAQESKSSASKDQIDKLVGSGTCTGKALGPDMKAFHATTGKYNAEKVLDGKWVELRFDEDQSATVSKPYHVVQYIGYDKAKNRYVSVLVDNSDSGYSTGTSAGWKGDSITFDEAEAGRPVAFRDTFMNNNGMSSHAGMLRDKTGKWIKTDEEHCKSS